MEPQYNLPTSTPTMMQGPGYPAPGGPMPGIVQVVRVLIILGLVLMGIAALVLAVVVFGGAAATALSGSPLGGVGMVMVAVIGYILLAIFFVLYIWMYRGMGTGVTAVWYVELVLLILGCLSVFEIFSHGTAAASGVVRAALSALILYYGLKPETKSYFNVR